MFSGIFLISSCNKDDYYYFEYKNLPSTKKDSLHVIEQCVVSRRPKSNENFLTLIVKGKYIGQKIIYYGLTQLMENWILTNELVFNLILIY